MLIDTRLNSEDYCLLPNNGKRYEIIDGELFVTPFPHLSPVPRLYAPSFPTRLVG